MLMTNSNYFRNWIHTHVDPGNAYTLHHICFPHSTLLNCSVNQNDCFFKCILVFALCHSVRIFNIYRQLDTMCAYVSPYLIYIFCNILPYASFPQVCICFLSEMGRQLWYRINLFKNEASFKVELAIQLKTHKLDCCAILWTLL